MCIRDRLRTTSIGNGVLDLNMRTDEGFCYLTEFDWNNTNSNPSAMECSIGVNSSGNWTLRGSSAGSNSAGFVLCNADCVKF